MSKADCALCRMITEENHIHIIEKCLYLEIHCKSKDVINKNLCKAKFLEFNEMNEIKVK